MTKAATARPRPPGDPVWRALEGVHGRVSALEHAMAPAFSAPIEKTVGQPERNTATSSGGMDWSRFPDHDPDYLQGKISLEQARLRHQRPDEGCQCEDCKHQRKVTAQRYTQPESAPEARCPFCRGSGYTAPTHPDASWAPCTACDADTYLRLRRESYNGNQYSVPSAVLVAARERIEACEECHGSGKVPTPVQYAPCSPCRGSGVDNHVVQPRGVLWPRAGGGAGEVVKASAPGQQEQSTNWTTRPEEGLPEPVSAITPSAAADMPGFAAARTHAAMITRPRN
jgi:DnaJ-class molecular chaperone